MQTHRDEGRCLNVQLKSNSKNGKAIGGIGLIQYTNLPINRILTQTIAASGNTFILLYQY